MSSKKRKRRGRPPNFDTAYPLPGSESSSQPIFDPHRNPTLPPDATLHIKAYEASVIRGPQAWRLAQSLEVTHVNGAEEKDAHERRVVGSALIQWGGSRTHGGTGVGEEFDSVDDRTGGEVWVDRYDARLLLDSLPPLNINVTQTESALSSPGGWSDMPSDAEDTFFLGPDELEDYRREKRRRSIERQRTARMDALRAEEGDAMPEEEPWGGSDEEPDVPQKELMRRTATHLLASPNPAQLEMRILANHGSDVRFAFLRGRWARAWRLERGRARMEKENAEKLAQSEKGLGGLTGYGDSDSDISGDEGSREEDTGARMVDLIGSPAEKRGSGGESAPSPDEEEEAQRARRARAKEWAEKRRASKGAPA